MSAVLIVLVQQYGLPGIWMAGVMAGLLLLIGLLRLGRFIAFIPSPVITGFTSGIALIIFIGQIDNFLGVNTAAAESAAEKLVGYFKGGFTPDWHTMTLGMVVILTMVFWPKKWNARFPGSLLGLILATIVNWIFQWPVAMIGEIPSTLILDERFNPPSSPGSVLQFHRAGADHHRPGRDESLLCGAVGSKMTGIRLQANQELIAQGVGNMLIPFFGGVPATAAIAARERGHQIRRADPHRQLHPRRGAAALDVPAGPAYERASRWRRWRAC